METSQSGKPVVMSPESGLRRSARLRAWRILDTPPDQSFDDVAQLAATLCGAPWARVNLLDDRRCWSKAQLGPGPREQPLDHSLCELTLAAPGVLVLPDLAMPDLVLPDLAMPDLAMPDLEGRSSEGARFYAGIAIRDADGLPVGTLCVLDPLPRPDGLTPAQTDGLARLARQAMAALTAHHAEAYRLAFQLAPVDLALIDVLDDQTFVCADHNQTHNRNTGLRTETFIGRTIEEALPPGTAAFALAKYQECLRTGATVTYEQTARFPIGDRLRHSFMVPLRDAGGRISRILLTSIDLTESRAVQAQMRQSQKMEALGQLAAGLAHDFNNLLATIVGNLELLTDDLADPSLLRRVETARRAAERGGLLTQQLLGFGRRQQATTSGMDANAAIGGMLELLQRSLGGLVTVEADFAPALWVAAAEASQLEQAILNLAINARDAMPDGGRMLIRTRNMPAGDPDQPSELLAGDYVLVSVTDEGTGMTPAVLERATEPFFTTKTAGNGSGLGLAQVYGFARQFGGTLRIDSAPGQGTRVTIILPRGAPIGEAPRQPPASLSPMAHRGRILVVDDEPDVRDAAIDVLVTAGHAACGAESAATALSMLATEPADLVLADHAMPGMSGTELIRRLRIHYPAQRALLMTGNPDAVLRHEDMRDETVLRKPFGVRTLLQAVETALTAARR